MLAPFVACTIAALALPALLSPLLFVPVPEGWAIPPTFIRVAVPLLVYPRLWAGAATLMACAWTVRSRANRWWKIGGLAVALLAWIPAWHTATRLAELERF